MFLADLSPAPPANEVDRTRRMNPGGTRLEGRRRRTAVQTV
jgi:hypothetical protein